MRKVHYLLLAAVVLHEGRAHPTFGLLADILESAVDSFGDGVKDAVETAGEWLGIDEVSYVKRPQVGDLGVLFDPFAETGAGQDSVEIVDEIQETIYERPSSGLNFGGFYGVAPIPQIPPTVTVNVNIDMTGTKPPNVNTNVTTTPKPSDGIVNATTTPKPSTVHVGSTATKKPSVHRVNVTTTPKPARKTTAKPNHPSVGVNSTKTPKSSGNGTDSASESDAEDIIVYPDVGPDGQLVIVLPTDLTDYSDGEEAVKKKKDGKA